METYAQARTRLHRELGTLGWKLSKPDLKRPWASKEVKAYVTHRVEFHAQAVYLDGHSLFVDIRGMSVEQFLSHVQAMVSK